MPPTPTPFPAPGSMPFDPSSFSLWQYTDWALHGWQFAGPWATVFQALLLLFLVGFGIRLLQIWLQRVGNDPTETTEV